MWCLQALDSPPARQPGSQVGRAKPQQEEPPWSCLDSEGETGNCLRESVHMARDGEEHQPSGGRAHPSICEAGSLIVEFRPSCQSYASGEDNNKQTSKRHDGSDGGGRCGWQQGKGEVVLRAAVFCGGPAAASLLS